MYSLSRTGRTRTTDIWPGFVDGLASLLLVVIFVLMVFMVAQFFLSAALTGRDEQLARLNQQISQLSDQLALERAANEELRSNVTELSSQLQASLSEQDDLSSQLAAITSERDVMKDSLTNIGEELEEAYKVIDADKAKIEAQLQELAILKSLRDELRAELEQTQDFVVDQQRQTEAALTRAQEAETALAETRAARQAALERAKLAESELEEMQEARQTALARAEEAETALEESESARLTALSRAEEAEQELARIENLRLFAEERAEQAEQELERTRARAEQAEQALSDSQSTQEQTRQQLVEQRRMTEEAERQVELLNRQILSLRKQLAQLNEALDAAEAKNERQQVQIADLGRRLNVALASKVQELARYRSEFFGRLREVLGDNPNIRIVGDRFVFQSELFFAQGEDELGDEGKEQLRQLAQTLKEIAGEIPDDIDWVLRVDGHTDRVPISTPDFPSNWELSTARAVSVVKFLIEQGIPADRLAAAGFGEYQPLVTSDDQDAYRRNRRIEIKFDQQ